jgi:hypothetical protein
MAEEQRVEVHEAAAGEAARGEAAAAVQPAAEETGARENLASAEVIETAPLSEYGALGGGEPVGEAAVGTAGENPVGQIEEPEGTAAWEETGEETGTDSDGPAGEEAGEEVGEASSYFAAQAIPVESFDPGSDLPPMGDVEPPTASSISEEAEGTAEGAEERAENEGTGEASEFELSPILPVREEVKESEAPAERAAELVEEPVEVTPPPPPRVAVPVAAPPPPKSRRGGRVAVTPVFDAVEEEPVPRRRGKFAIRSEAAEQTDAPVALPVDAVATPVEPPVVESPREEVAGASETPALDESGVGAVPRPADAVSISPSREDPPILASTAMQSMPVMERTLQDWAAIRRSLALLAVMSVIIAVVLIAVLLAIVGIIPRK